MKFFPGYFLEPVFRFADSKSVSQRFMSLVSKIISVKSERSTLPAYRGYFERVGTFWDG